MSKSALYLAYAATTLDGKIARHKRHFSDWTSREDKEFFQKELARADVIMAGNDTYKTAKKPLSKRNCIVLTHRVKHALQKAPNLIYCNPKGKHPKVVIEEKGYKRVAVIGGSQVYSFAADEGMMDELHITLEPLVFGEGIPLFDREPKCSFTLRSVKKLNARGTLHLLYKVR